MTTFLYIADTHIGAGPEGYTQQPRALERLAALLSGMRSWLATNNVDFVLHGGDLVEHGDEDEIREAVAMMVSLDVPVYLCLGNHDLSLPESRGYWRRHGGALLPEGRGERGGRFSYAVPFAEFNLYVMAHHWNSLEPPHCWQPRDQLTPLLDEEQKRRFEEFLAAKRKPVIAAVHALLNAIPAAQTGWAEDFHLPDAAFREYFLSLAERFPHFKLVLAAHNHVNTSAEQNSLVTMTTAALVESPFEARLIEVTAGNIQVSTVAFGKILGLEYEYDESKAWVQGTGRIREWRIC